MCNYSFPDSINLSKASKNFISKIDISPNTNIFLSSFDFTQVIKYLNDVLSLYKEKIKMISLDVAPR